MRTLIVTDGHTDEELGRLWLEDGQPRASGPMADTLLGVKGGNLTPADGDAWLERIGRILDRLHIWARIEDDAVAKQDAWQAEVTIAKVDAVKRIAVGVVLAPRPKEDPDLQGDWYDPEDIEEAAHHFMREVAAGTGWGDVMHDEVTKAGTPVESYIAPVDFALGDQMVRAGSWVVGMHYPDDGIWKRIEAGEFAAFSVGGFGVRTED